MPFVTSFLEKTCARYPENIAFADQTTTLTWSQFQSEVKRIATALVPLFPLRQPIAVLMDKNVHAVSCFLASATIGSPYTFLDITLPDERLLSMLSTLHTNVVLTTQAGEAKAKRLGCTALVVDTLSLGVDEALLSARSALRSEDDPLSIMFTSGSTGKPKGIVISQRNMVSFITTFVSLFSITSDDRIANQAPFDFDVSSKDIYSAIVTGASVYLVPKQYFSFPKLLLDFLEEKQITTLIWAVSALCIVSTLDGFSYKVPTSVKNVLFSGEVMPPKQLRIWREHLPDTRFVNLYGPTEITCNCTYHRVSDADTGAIPLGKPFPGEHLFLLDEQNRRVSEPGASGEICVSSPTVALGYYEEKALSDRSFVQNPLNDEYREIIYKTGDIAEIREDGMWVYTGRKDFQIKHMGHRIELSEIDLAAESVSGIERACTLFHDDKLELFYIGSAEKPAIIKELRTHLPSFMLPFGYHGVSSFPLNAHGKIDRKALEATLDQA